MNPQERLAGQIEAMLRSGKSAQEVAEQFGGFFVDIKAGSVEDAGKQAERMADAMRRSQ